MAPTAIKEIADDVVSDLKAHLEEKQHLLSTTRPTAAPNGLKQWNHGLFAAELAHNAIFPRKVTTTDGSNLNTPSDLPPPLLNGTYSGTKLAMTQMYNMIRQRYESYFDIANFEPTIPQEHDFNAQKLKYTWQEPGTTTPSYPPCLAMIPPEDRTGLLQIFNSMRLLDTGLLQLRIIPKNISDFIYGTPYAETMAGCEAENRKLYVQGKNIGQEINVADRPDWYTDAVFAQQSFTGANPTTITLASKAWIKKFTEVAQVQRNDAMHKLLSTADPDCIYIQDYSYFREAVGATPDATLKSDDGERFGCSSVTLFQLNEEGRLHPLAIVLDYKGSMEKSVVIFNQRLRDTDSTKTEHGDWPWRYAKICSQVSDWTRHEIAIHLNDCHFVEEATIVAAYRSFSADHVVFKLLQPHWFKTLSLNAAARATLVPAFVTQINGFTSDQTYAFIQDAYKRFNWEAHYIPNDLKSRGFPESKLGDKLFHNYAYARNMSLMWPVLFNFVHAVMKGFYSSDADVAKDSAVASWSAEMQSPKGGQMPSFPTIKTIEQLTNAVVMCIHIASPQHNAVNYLQCYYQSFVPAKPASLMAALPQSLEELQAYREPEMMAALPNHAPRVWLMSSQLPYLLSYQVAEDQTLLNYALSLQSLAMQNINNPKWKNVAEATTKFYKDLLDLGLKFRENSDQMDRDVVEYHVMDPTDLAVSVLI